MFMVNEIFESIQGEGKYVGFPVLFIRLSGCNNKCDWCDTKYHINGKKYSVNKIAKIINKSKKNIVVWTGGEPLLQFDDIRKCKSLIKNKDFHLESNGKIFKQDMIHVFDYVCVSPKCIDDALHCLDELSPIRKDLYDIKVVTDLKNINTNFIKTATELMPFCSFIKSRDEAVKKNVWNYCVLNNIRFCPRIHIDVFGKRKGV